MKFLILLAGAFIATNAHAQKNNVIVKFCPLALGDIVSFPTIQAGIEYKLSNRIGWYNEFGIQYFVPSNQKTDTSFLSPHGYKFKTEFIYYLSRKKSGNKKPAVRKFYIAANAFFTHQAYNTEVAYYPGSDSSQIASDGFGVKKDIWGLNAVFGIQRSIGKKFMVEFYGGVGIRFRYVTTFDKEIIYGKDVLIRPIDISIPAMKAETDTKAGFSVAPNLTIGLRFCYRF